MCNKYNWTCNNHGKHCIERASCVLPGAQEKNHTIKEIREDFAEGVAEVIWHFQAMYSAVPLVMLNKVIIDNSLAVL
jgi:hypothetical protein